MPVENHLKNCESNIPRTELDIVLSAVGLDNVQARGCLEQKLQTVKKKICQSKGDLYTKEAIYKAQNRIRNGDQRYRKYRIRREISRVQKGIDRVEEMYEDYQDWLLDQADHFYAEADRYDYYSSSAMWHDELKAYAEIFEYESESDCS